jgi:hypothetical protein
MLSLYLVRENDIIHIPCQEFLLDSTGSVTTPNRKEVGSQDVVRPLRFCPTTVGSKV